MGEWKARCREGKRRPRLCESSLCWQILSPPQADLMTSPSLAAHIHVVTMPPHLPPTRHPGDPCWIRRASPSTRAA
jgi:hypothetical protein